MLAVALVNDGSAQSKEGLLFSVFATDRLRSFLVTVGGGVNDIVDFAFPRLDAVIFQNPTKLTSTQLLGMLLSCESGPSNLCGSVLPVDKLELLSRLSLSHGNLKSFFSMYAEVVPSVAFVETSAHKEPPPVPIRGKAAAHLDSPTEAAVELLLTTLREKLLQVRTSSTTAASPSSNYQTPIKAARHFMEPNPLLDQWLRGLWGLELDPQSPALSRISVRLAGATTWSNSANTPDTDTSTCSNLDSLRDDANLLIDAKLALVDALSERLPVSRGFRLPQSKSFSSCAEHGLETLWPAVVLAEAFGCQSLLASLLVALKAVVTSTSPLESAYCEDTCAAMGLVMKGDDALRLFETLAAHFAKFGTGSRNLVPRNDSGNWSPQTDGECATPSDDNTGIRDTFHELYISPIEDDWIDGARGNDPPQPLMSPPVPHNAPGHPLEDAHRGVSQDSENDDRQQREAIFDRSDSEDDDGESCDNGFDDSSEPTGGFDDDPRELGVRSRGRYAQLEETQSERRRQDGTAFLRPSPTDFEPELGTPRNSNVARGYNQSGFDAFNCSSTCRGSSSSSFVDSNLSRSLATMRVQSQLREKRAQEASKAAEKALRASRLKSVELAQRMARVGWGNRSILKSSHDRVALDLAAARQSWSDLLEQEARAAVRVGEATMNSYSSPKVTANRSVLSTSINPPLSESAAAAQRRAAQRVKERSRQMLTKQQLATIEKKEREDAMWRERDRRIKLFVERQKGGQLYLMSTGSTPPSEWAGGYSSTRSGSGSPSHRIDQRRQHHGDSDDDDEDEDEAASGVALAVHKRQPWAVGSPDPVAAKGDRGEGLGCSPRASYTLTPTVHHYGNCDGDGDSSDGDDDHYVCDGGEINLGFFALREPVEGGVGNGMNHAAELIETHNAAVLPPPPPPPLSHVGITVLCARNLNEGLGGCSPYVVLDWSYLGRQSTQPPPSSASPSLRSNNTNPSFGVKMLFKPPFLWAGVSAGGDADGNDRASSLYDLDRELDGKEVLITTPSKGSGSSSVTTAATLCAPILRVYVYSRNISVSDELLGEGEVDVETMLYACQQGLPFTVELFDTVNGKHAAGSVEMRFEL